MRNKHTSHALSLKHPSGLRKQLQPAGFGSQSSSKTLRYRATLLSHYLRRLPHMISQKSWCLCWWLRCSLQNQMTFRVNRLEPKLLSTALKQQLSLLQKVCETISQYGCGVNALGVPVKIRKESRPPRHFLPEAGDNFTDKQKTVQEAKLFKQRDELRSKIEQLEGKLIMHRGQTFQASRACCARARARARARFVFQKRFFLSKKKTMLQSQALGRSSDHLPERRSMRLLSSRWACVSPP